MHPHTQFHPFYVTTPPYEGFFNLNAEVAFLAGATSGGFITVLSCPFEFTKLATQIELLLRRKKNIHSNVPISNEPKTPLQMTKDIYFGRGFRGLYSGFSYHLGIPPLFQESIGNGRSRCGGNGDLFWIVWKFKVFIKWTTTTRARDVRSLRSSLWNHRMVCCIPHRHCKSPLPLPYAHISQLNGRVLFNEIF